MTTHHPTTRRLVYGHAQMHDCLAFADADTAAEEAAEIKAIAAARAWVRPGGSGPPTCRTPPTRSATTPTRAPTTTNRSTSTR